MGSTSLCSTFYFSPSNVPTQYKFPSNLSYLQVLVKSKPKLRKLLIEHGPVSLITSICECALSLLKGVIPLTPHQKRRLTWYKTHLRRLASKKVSQKRKKQFLNHKGGNLLTALLPPVLSVLGGLLTI